MKKTKKEFDSVDFMRKQREKIGRKIGKMSKEDIITYFESQRANLTIKPSKI
jgi:hypothetical protein